MDIHYPSFTNTASQMKFWQLLAWGKVLDLKNNNKKKTIRMVRAWRAFREGGTWHGQDAASQTNDGHQRRLKKKQYALTEWIKRGVGVLLGRFMCSILKTTKVMKKKRMKKIKTWALKTVLMKPKRVPLSSDLSTHLAPLAHLALELTPLGPGPPPPPQAQARLPPPADRTQIETQHKRAIPSATMSPISGPQPHRAHINHHV